MDLDGEYPDPESSEWLERMYRALLARMISELLSTGQGSWTRDEIAAWLPGLNRYQLLQLLDHSMYQDHVWLSGIRYCVSRTARVSA